MVQQPVEHGGCQCLVVGEGAGPLAKRQIARQDQAPLLMEWSPPLRPASNVPKWDDESSL